MILDIYYSLIITTNATTAIAIAIAIIATIVVTGESYLLMDRLNRIGEIFLMQVGSYFLLTCSIFK